MNISSVHLYDVADLTIRHIKHCIISINAPIAEGLCSFALKKGNAYQLLPIFTIVSKD